LQVGDPPLEALNNYDIYFCNQLGPNVLYRNNGDGTFTDVAQKAGVALGDRVCVGATFADYRNEGRPSLFVTSTRGGNVLFHNNDDVTFSDVTLDLLGRTPWGSIGARLLDYNNDGRLDLLAVDMHSDMWMGADFDHTSLQDALRESPPRSGMPSSTRSGRCPGSSGPS
jgi:hypothetical protein